MSTANSNELKQIEPRPCELGPLNNRCTNVAYWSYNGVAVCYADLKAMSDMNSDNAKAFASALDFFSEPDPERAKQILDQIYSNEHPF
jgi:hypothetical protein